MSKLTPWRTLVRPKDFSMFWNDTVAMRYLESNPAEVPWLQLFTAPAVSPPTM